MCYTIDGLLKKQIRHAQRKGAPTDFINALIDQYNNLSESGDAMPRVYHNVSGFAHPALFIMALLPAGPQVQPMQWGLVPHWCADTPTAAKLANQCLNARSETMEEKPAFRTAAGRGVVAVGGFYEYHHFLNQAYPFYVHSPTEAPLLMAALWDEWVNTTTGEVMRSFAIVTTMGQGLMATLHNSPKAEGSRMPLILQSDQLEQWLTTPEVPSPNVALQAHTVRPLVGKLAAGNTPEAKAPYAYPELAFDTELHEALES
jgi:putative SOS response-associated peptidase YedK